MRTLKKIPAFSLCFGWYASFMTFRTRSPCERLLRRYLPPPAAVYTPVGFPLIFVAHTFGRFWNKMILSFSQRETRTSPPRTHRSSIPTHFVWSRYFRSHLLGLARVEAVINICMIEDMFSWVGSAHCTDRVHHLSHDIRLGSE